MQSNLSKRLLASLLGLMMLTLSVLPTFASSQSGSGFLGQGWIIIGNEALKAGLSDHAVGAYLLAAVWGHILGPPIGIIYAT